MPAQHHHRFTDAVLAQLGAEIAAHNESVTSVARGIDRNYDTIRRYVVGDKDMPVDVLWTILEFLEVDPVVFLKRAGERLQPPAPQ